MNGNSPVVLLLKTISPVVSLIREMDGFIPLTRGIQRVTICGLLSAICCLLLTAAGCGVYSFSGSTLSGIKTIAVPLFDDQTGEYGMQEVLTEKIADRFVRDNTLKVVNEKNADSILDGVITNYSREAYTFDEQENIREYIVRIWVKVSFEQKKDKKSIWKDDNLLGWGVYSAQDETEDQGKERAMEKLAEDIVNKTVKGW